MLYVLDKDLISLRISCIFAPGKHTVFVESGFLFSILAASINFTMLLPITSNSRGCVELSVLGFVELIFS